MKNRFKEVEKLLFFSIMFTIILLTGRIILYGTGMFVFLVWNIFLAVVPLIISRAVLQQAAINVKVICLLSGWFIFFPNAPYIITDIFHFTERPPVPKWVDLLIIMSAAWNGLVIGVVSLLQVEEFLSRHIKARAVNLIVSLSIISSAFGIYLGRFLRFNSWDVIANPRGLATELASRFINPMAHPRTWGFTFLFGTMFFIFFALLKKYLPFFQRGFYPPNRISSTSYYV